MHIPSRQSPSRYLLRPSWGKDPKDQSWEQVRTRHRPHHPLLEGDCEIHVSKCCAPVLLLRWTCSTTKIRRGEYLHHLDLIGVYLGSWMSQRDVSQSSEFPEYRPYACLRLMLSIVVLFARLSWIFRFHIKNHSVGGNSLSSHLGRAKPSARLNAKPASSRWGSPQPHDSITVDIWWHSGSRRWPGSPGVDMTLCSHHAKRACHLSERPWEQTSRSYHMNYPFDHNGELYCFLNLWILTESWFNASRVCFFDVLNSSLSTLLR